MLLYGTRYFYLPEAVLVSFISSYNAFIDLQNLIPYTNGFGISRDRRPKGRRDIFIHKAHEILGALV